MLRFSMITSALLAIAMTVFAIFVVTYAGAKEVDASHSVFHYGKMQMYYAFAGGAVALFFAWFDYHHYKKKFWLWFIAGGAVFALLLVLIPGIGVAVKGSRRWIGFGSLRLQPVEFVKVAVIVVLSAHMDNVGGLFNRNLKELLFSKLFFQTLLLPVFLVFLSAAFLILQPDFGATVIVLCLAGVIALVGGFGWKRCLCIGITALVFVGIILSFNENRMKRLQNHSEGVSYQEQQSQIAFHNGGLTGEGLGKGMQRQGYLPECHTDFILSIVGEDFGFVGTITVLMGFLLLLSCGVIIACHAPDKQGMLLAFGATMMICAQAAANMAVVTGVFPTKGLALPFFSYGGSCLLASSAAMGLLYGVGRKARQAAFVQQRRPHIHSILKDV